MSLNEVAYIHKANAEEDIMKRPENSVLITKCWFIYTESTIVSLPELVYFSYNHKRLTKKEIHQQIKHGLFKGKVKRAQMKEKRKWR